MSGPLLDRLAAQATGHRGLVTANIGEQPDLVGASSMKSDIGWGTPSARGWPAAR